MTRPRVVHVELLVGRKVRDPAGECVGRLEECLVEVQDGLHVVREFHVGKYAMLERLMGRGAVGRSLLRLLGGRIRRAFVIPWEHIDLSDPRDLRISVSARELGEVERPVSRRVAAP
jgi:hypothetical protein